MDKWHGLVFIALFAVAMIVGAHTFYHLWRRRNRLPELQRQRGEPVWQPPLMPDAGAVAPGEAIRCVLTEWAPGLKTRVVAIDIGQDAIWVRQREVWTCLLYTSDAADE